MIDKRQHIFECQIEVRDYELDAEGIVNNANYLHYFEHTRHCFCKSEGFSFADIRKQGLDPVLAKITVGYRTPLVSGDVVTSRLSMRRQGPRFIFDQWLINEKGELVAEGEITVVTLKNGQLSRGDELAAPFAKYLK